MVVELGCQLKLPAWTLAWIAGKTAFCVRLSSASGTQSVMISTGSDGRNGNIDGADRENHRPAGNEHCHQAHGKDGCRAARAYPDGPLADADQRPDHTGARSVNRVDRHEGVGKAWQAGRICEIGQFMRGSTSKFIISG